VKPRVSQAQRTRSLQQLDRRNPCRGRSRAATGGERRCTAEPRPELTVFSISPYGRGIACPGWRKAA